MISKHMKKDKRCNLREHLFLTFKLKEVDFGSVSALTICNSGRI